MKGLHRGWIIIGFDLLFVLGVYFLYSQFALTPSPNKMTLGDTLRYEVSVSPPSKDTVPIKFAISNPSTESHTVTFPEGIVLFLTTGRETEGTDHFWATRPISSGSVTLSPGETRSWQFSPQLPASRPSPLYVAFYADESRQDKVMVPE